MIEDKLNIIELEADWKNTDIPTNERYHVAIQLIQHFIFHDIEKALTILNATDIQLLKDLPKKTLKWYFYKGFIYNQIENYELAIDSYKNALFLSEIGTIEFCEINIELAATYINLKKYDVCFNLLNSIQNYINELNSSFLTVKYNCRLGYYFLNTKKYVEAHEKFRIANDISENFINFESNTFIYYYTLIISGLGKIDELNKNHNNAISNYLMVVNIAETYKIENRLNWHYLNLANTYLALQEDEMAYENYQKVLHLDQNKNSITYAAALANIGFLQLKTYNLKDALNSLKASKEIFLLKDTKDYYNLSNIELYLAQISKFEKDKKKTKIQLEKALDYAQLNGDKNQIAGVCKIVSSYFAENNDFKNAYEYQILYNQIASSLNNEENNRRILELELKSNKEKKEKEIEILKLQAIGLQLKALRAQMNPHFVYNALNGIQNFISSNRNIEAVKYLAKFAKLMRQSLEYSDVERISLDQEIEFLKNYLDVNKELRYQNRFKYLIKIDSNIEPEFTFIPSMIIQPYVENALEHGLRSIDNGELIIIFNICSENSIKCIIDDNGIGREKVKKMQEKWDYHQDHKSRGTQITEQRLILLTQLNKTELDIKIIDKYDSKNYANGTRVELQLPVFDKK